LLNWTGWQPVHNPHGKFKMETDDNTNPSNFERNLRRGAQVWLLIVVLPLCCVGGSMAWQTQAKINETVKKSGELDR
jgi:hypothetical protein